MREDEDHIRQYMPVLRRIIILVAVLTAIPVVMWTITAFVRTYVGPPKLPTFHPIAANVNIGPDDAAAATSDANPDARGQPTILSARTSAADAGAAVPLTATKAVGAPAVQSVPAASAPAPAAAPFGPPYSAAQYAPVQQPASVWPTPATVAVSAEEPEALPPTEPITGPVPLPRQRPRSFAVAQNGVPLPRSRPETAGPAAPETPATPFNWLQGIFQQSQPANEGTGPH
jgi:hypothetical protein